MRSASAAPLPPFLFAVALVLARRALCVATIVARILSVIASSLPALLAGVTVLLGLCLGQLDVIALTNLCGAIAPVPDVIAPAPEAATMYAQESMT